MRDATRRSLSIALGALIAIASAAPVGAQVNPLWDHYKVYQVLNPVTGAPPVVLSDQFLPSFTHTVGPLELFENPTAKQVPGLPPFPINNPRLHYTWWRISEHPWSATVQALNQFGDQTLQVGRPLYLLNPALKNETGPPLPPANHYKCYDCVGQPVNRPVTLTDQFGVWQATATIPRFFCNPVRKTNTQNGNVYDIVDPLQHYVCYELQPPDTRLFNGVVTDQFIQQRPLELQPGRLLCVPTHKERVTSSRTDTWGKLKLMYR